MEDYLACHIQNNFKELTQCNYTVSVFLKQHRVHPKAIYAANLAVEEMISNTIRYGYNDDQTHDIRIDVRVGSGEILITIEDDGQEFDPLAAPEPPIASSLQEAQVGGLGIHMVRTMVNTIHYRRTGPRNVLEIRIANPA